MRRLVAVIALVLLLGVISVGGVGLCGAAWLYTHTMWCDDTEWGDGVVVWRDFSVQPWTVREWLGETDKTLADLTPRQAAETRRWQAECLQPNGFRRQGWPLSDTVFLLF